MLSSDAESIYWMGRYVERAENTARLVNVNVNLMLDMPRQVRPGWRVLVEIIGSQGLFEKLYTRAEERDVVRFLLGDARNPGSMLSSLQLARENARTMRDLIPGEAWEQLNSLHAYAQQQLAAGLTQKRRFDYLRGIIVGAQTFNGIIAGTMTRDHGYDFLRIGRNLERADMTTRIIDVRSAEMPAALDDLGAPYANLQWMSVLKSLTAYQMYRRAMQVRVRRPEVLRFLFHDSRFPRAFRHCVEQVEGCLVALPRGSAPLGIARRVIATLETGDPEQLEQVALHTFIDELQLGLAELTDAIRATYFRLERPQQAREKGDRGRAPQAAAQRADEEQAATVSTAPARSTSAAVSSINSRSDSPSS